MPQNPIAVGIIGAGPGGIALGTLLVKAGFRDSLRYRRRTGATYVAVRPEAMASFLAKIDVWMRGTVWTTQCSNYFRPANGRAVTQWPRSARAFWGMTRRFRPADFTFEPVYR